MTVVKFSLLTDPNMRPLQDFSFSSFSRVIVKSVRKSKFKLFTGGRFIFTVATPKTSKDKDQKKSTY